MRRALVLFALVLFTIGGGSSLAPSTVQAATLTVAAGVVATDGTDGACSLREAIANANDTTTGQPHPNCAQGDPGGVDVIVLPAGTYTLSPNGELPAITSTITIVGAGAATTIIDANFGSRHFTVSASGDLTLDGVTLTGGSTIVSSGGAIDNFGHLSITNSTFSGNSADIGGAIENDGGDLSITNSTLSGNSAAFGGAIDNNGGVLSITNSTLSSNSAVNDGLGGAIYNGGDLSITNSTLSGNEAVADGGAIENFGDLSIINSTLSGNSAGGTGGAIDNNIGDLSITNSTLSGNSAVFGGAIYDLESDASITNSTLSGNSATVGGAIYNLGGGTVATNTIIAGGLSGANCVILAGSITATDSISDDATCPGATQGDPALGPLQDNGGPTQTHAITVDSPAYNTGNQATCNALVDADDIPITTDQRGPGFSRTIGGTCDIGAFELQEAVTNLTIAKTDHADPVLAGDELSYTITVSNDGPSTATNIVVTDILAEGATLVATEGCAEDPSGAPTCTVGTLDPGQSASVEVTVTAHEGGTLTNIATVSSSATDLDPSDNSATETTRVLAPELSIGKEGPDAAPPEAAVVYAVTVTNRGDGEAREVVIADALTGGSLASIDAPSGVACETDGDSVTCTLDEPLPSGGEVVIWVHTTAPETLGTTGMVNRACVETSTPGDDASDNCDTVGTSIVADVPFPPLPAVGPHLYQPEPRPTPSATETPEPTATATLEPAETPSPTPTSTPPSEPEPTATTTSEPTVPAPTATSTPDSGSGAGGTTPTATATPVREAPMPPDTGSGSAGNGGSGVWLALLGLSVLAIGGGVLLGGRRS